MAKTIVFRCDASLAIGTGHVMRCLSLATEFESRGFQCIFVCIEWRGNLTERIRAMGFRVLTTVPPRDDMVGFCPQSQVLLRNDASRTIALLKKMRLALTVLDHYQLDIEWERELRVYSEAILVIDDLANRSHACDILLDQNAGREHRDYECLVPSDCRVLIGPRYALLRREFGMNRIRSLQKRSRTPIRIRDVLISIGGVDLENLTERVLIALAALSTDWRMVVVLGEASPWIDSVTSAARTLFADIDVRVGVSNIAELMASSDLMIGSAGSTSWERCCLGLPSLLIVAADNQQIVARHLSRMGVARIVDRERPLLEELGRHIEGFSQHPEELAEMANIGSSLVDGEGVRRVADCVLNIAHSDTRE